MKVISLNAVKEWAIESDQATGLDHFVLGWFVKNRILQGLSASPILSIIIYNSKMIEIMESL